MAVHPKDILFGRGRPFQSHPGNMRMKRILEPYISVYQSAPRHLKTGITKHVIRVLRQGGTGKEGCSAQKTTGVPGLLQRSDKTPPERNHITRFLKQKPQNDNGDSSKKLQWVEASEAEIFSKVSHCLRKKDLPSASIILSGCKTKILTQEPHRLIKSTDRRPVHGLCNTTTTTTTTTPRSQQQPPFFPLGLVVNYIIKPEPLRGPFDGCFSLDDFANRVEQSRASLYEKVLDVPDHLFENGRLRRSLLEPNRLVFNDPGDLPPSPSIFD